MTKKEEKGGRRFSMDQWMKRLAEHYEQVREDHPDEKLMIMFDIDGTILDMRYMILNLLQSYDREHGSAHFSHLKIQHINIHESEPEKILDDLNISAEDKLDILLWYAENCWSGKAIMEAHRPFVGVLEVIRWFQLQPNTYVGLNTGRPDSIRNETLAYLNRIGSEFKVHFTNDLLYMNIHGWGADIVTSKIAGLVSFQKAGYRVFAFVDNELDNLAAIADLDRKQKVLLLHADTICKSKRRKHTANMVSGKRYDLSQLMDRSSLPRHIQFVWQGLENWAKVQQFLNSTIRWAGFYVRLDSEGELCLAHNSKAMSDRDETPIRFNLQDTIMLLRERGKAIKLDLKQENFDIDKLIRQLRFIGYQKTDLWFNGQIEDLRESGFRKLAEAFPFAVIQCPVDTLVPLIISAPGKALAVLDMFSDWGINRFSICWNTPHKRKIIDKISEWGFEANIYKIPDLESFLRAVLILPTSITSDFDYPKWHQTTASSRRLGGCRIESSQTAAI